MSSQPVRSNLVIAAAIVMAGVLIPASLFVATDGMRPTITKTVTTTITTTITATSTAAETSGVGDLVFKQSTPCPNIGYIAPWTVTLSDGQSVTAEGNSSQCCGGSPNNPSIIAFLVPNGNYTYSVTAENRLTPSAGTVTVDNEEVVVTLGLFLSSCGPSTTASG